MDRGHVTLLVMLDLSAAFDHGILLHRLQSKLGLRDKTLLWLKSYLAGRTQQVSVNGTLSEKFNLTQGRIQEFLIGGVQTLVQKGLLDSFKANYFSPHTPSHQSRLYVIWAAHRLL